MFVMVVIYRPDVRGEGSWKKESYQAWLACGILETADKYEDAE